MNVFFRYSRAREFGLTDPADIPADVTIAAADLAGKSDAEILSVVKSRLTTAVVEPAKVER